MAGGKITPRQKMINMMYLVLTALLALNVSAEILNAFKLVKGSLEKTNVGIDESIESQRISVINLAKKNKDNKSIPVFQALYEEIETEIVAMEEFIAVIDGKIEKEAKGKDDDTESTDRLLAEGKDGKDLESNLKALADMIEGYSIQDRVSAITSSGELGSFPEGFVDQFVKKFAGESADYDFEGNIKGSLTYDLVVEDKDAETKVWHEYNFHGVPAIGARTILTKLITDLKNMKKAAASFTLQGAKASTTQKLFFYPVIATNSSFLAPGEQFEAKFSVGSYDPEAETSGSNEVPEYYLGTYTPEFMTAIVELDSSNARGEATSGGPYAVTYLDWPFTEGKEELTPLPKDEAGNIVYSEAAGTTSIKTGALKLGNFWYPFETGYSVQKSGGGSYLLEKMNVMFAGVGNPITVSLGSAEVNNVSFTCGSVRRGSGDNSFIVNPGSPGGAEKVCQMTIKGTDKGEPVSEQFPIRVRDFPPPAARHKSLRVGETKMTRGQVCGFSNNSIVATPDANSLAALFDVKFDVLSWDATVTLRGEMPTKASPNQIASACEEPTAVGATITVYNIKARAPSGTIVDLAPVSYSVK
ncbi:MAG: hypothetical protein DBW80_02565 [Bacteroidetes bacterium]|nr:MAG: hypothetical protein DBW80_02565 [Bacteroidota bacterium]